jgi:signal recognition particle subunit SRP54
MLHELGEKLESAFRHLRGLGAITEQNIAEPLREIRRSLLEADVNYKVVRDLIAKVKDDALGIAVTKSVAPGQQIVKFFHDRLIDVLGGDQQPFQFSGGPQIVMVVGLQGSGKTTFCAKLAQWGKKQSRKPGFVALDPYRPAAAEQLRVLGKNIQVESYGTLTDQVVDSAVNGVEAAQAAGCDLIILDTAGRLHVDDDLMAELGRVSKTINPHHVFFVADGMTGQDAVNTATAFGNQLPIGGVILTKLDGDARGGAALSMRAVSGQPILFIGVGEKMPDLEVFEPSRFASRLLGMGDVISLVQRAEEVVDQEQAEKMQRKLAKAELTLQDYLEQIQQLKQMGPLEQLLDMLPMGRQLKSMPLDEHALVRTEAIINSMTPEERAHPRVLNASRKKRIARGSGTTPYDVNRLVDQFYQMQKMLKRMNRMGSKKVKKMTSIFPGF